MRNLKTITTGSNVPVAVKFNDVKPLTYEGQIVRNGRLETVLNDQWIYVSDHRGNLVSINTRRSAYCVKRQLESIKIADAIGNRRMTNKLKSFIANISDSILFTKDEVCYRVQLVNKGSYVDIDCAKPYWLNTVFINKRVEELPVKYRTQQSCVWGHDLKITF